MFLRDFRKHPASLADLLNYAALVDEGVVLLKDGALLAGWYFEGPDMHSSSDDELAAMSLQMNSMIGQLGDGWVMHVDMIRRESVQYSLDSVFPDRATRLIEQERRDTYEAEGSHYENKYVLTLTYLPPPDVETHLTNWLRKKQKSISTNWQQTLLLFKKALSSFEDALSLRLAMERMTSEDLLSYLNFVVTGVEQRIRVPDVPMYLDCLLGNKDLYGGLKPRIGAQHIRVISVCGFPIYSTPEILSFLSTVSCKLRWSTRFIFFDTLTAEKRIKWIRTMWFSKRFGAWALLQSILRLPVEGFTDHDAVNMAQDADYAVTEASEGVVRYGEFTAVVVLSSEDRQEVEENARLIEKQFKHNRFNVFIEEENALEALRGSWPGHASHNVRRPILHTLNLVHMLPLTSIWPGLEHNPSPMYPKNSPPLLYAATSGATPFRLNLHDRSIPDVGHTLIIGPTGTGKSTLLNLIIAQFFRYPGAQVFSFDKGYSSYMLAKACGGAHNDLAGPRGKDIMLCPMEYIESESERIKAQDWLESAIELQGTPIDARKRKVLGKAIELLAASPFRSLSQLAVQDTELRAALDHYLIDGGMPLLDGRTNSFEHGANFTVYELEHLLKLGHKNCVPVLLWLFHYVERQLTGKPTLIVVEEAGTLRTNDIFRKKSNEWVLECRKKNASLIFIFQNPAQVLEHDEQSSLLSSCPTKIFLPNPEAKSEHNKRLYTSIGLSERQIEILAHAVPKQQYYFTSPTGNRLFELDLGPAAMAFIGHTDQESLAHVDELISEHAENWPREWLDQLGMRNASRQFNEEDYVQALREAAR